jgi:hypothetical protein
MPVLDPRNAPAFFATLEHQLAAFTPELTDSGSGNVTALLQILAQYLALTAQRLNQAPDKNFLAFLDMLAISALPPQPARVPLVFTPLPTGVNGTVPAGTSAGASVPGVSTPLMFQTESAIAMCAAKLVAAVSLWPDHDAWRDHSNSLAGGRSFQIFESLNAVRHDFYLAHDNLLAFMGDSTVEVSMNFKPAGSAALQTTWEYWDGQVWRQFVEFDSTDSTASQDGTAGFTRNGTVTLRAACGNSAATSVYNLDSHWIRGVLAQSLPPDPTLVLAQVDQIQLRVTVNRALVAESGGGYTGVVPIDAVYADTQKLDLSKIFYPFGKSPGTDSAFYLVCSEAFAKAGAKVTIYFEHASTPDQEADGLSASYGIDVNQAQGDLNKVGGDIANAIFQAASAADAVSTNPSDAQSQLTAFQNLANQFTASGQSPPSISDLTTAYNNLASALGNDVGGSISDLLSKMLNSWNGSLGAMNEGINALKELAQLSAPAALAGTGTPPPVLPAPNLIWEYWNGDQWSTLFEAGTNETENLKKTGSFSFTVPDDLKSYSLNGQTSLAVRARLASGSYNELRIISWTDPTTQHVSYYAVILPRPPAIKNFCLGYTWRSAWATPQQCLTFNDFVVEDHTADVKSPGTSFPLLHPVADTSPALYLGFNQPLPNDLVSLYFDIRENDEDGPPLVWEAWDGATWQTLAVQDGTGALARSGMVAFLEPVVAARPSATVTSASGTAIVTSNALQAAQFVSGNQVVIVSGNSSELATVASVQGAKLALQLPLGGSYTNGTVQLAALPRFGTSLDWVRARLSQDGAPETSKVNNIYLNAAWADQLRTVTNEVLGSGLGRSSQTFFFSQFPVLPGERVEVCELTGAQANVQFPILQQQLLALGFTNDDIRTVADPRTGDLTQVWVRWREQDTLYFSGPDDRDYTIERTRGRIVFGDGVNGMLLNSNVSATLYQAGGGSVGDVAKSTITQLMSGVTAQGVTNPVAAEAGADGETLPGVEWRGPQVLRHRYRAISAADYEALAREASPGVAVSRALPATAENFLPVPGCVTVIIVPQSNDPQPQPSYELRQEVAAYLAARAPASVDAGNIAVIGPTYLAVGVSATIAPLELDQAGTVKTAALAALAAFFDPLTGGRDGDGWPFGRAVHASDVAMLLESITGVDYVTNLELLLDQIPQGDIVSVPSNLIVAAGAMAISMEGAPTL